MIWNETAEVCAAARGLEAFVEALLAKRAMSEVAGNQSLTRHDCDSGGMTWNDAANVCGGAAEAAEANVRAPGYAANGHASGRGRGRPASYQTGLR